MKKIALLFVAMFAMVQMNAATDAATTESAPEAPTAVAADDNDSPYKRPFTNDGESKSHWSVVTDGFYLGMGIKHDWDVINNSFEIGLLNIVGVRYNSLHGQTLSLGMGIHHRSYSMKRPNMLERAAASQVVTVGVYPTLNDEIKDRASNLNLWTLQFPLMFSQRIYKKLNITVAGIMNWNTYARVDNHYEMNKIDYDTRYKDLKQNKINFDFMGSLTWNEFGVYCRYSPGKFFEEGYGPEIKKTWTLGIMLGL